MTTDIEIIRKELENFQEIETPIKLKPNTIVKYITLKEDIEKFYSGGIYCACKNNKVLLKNKYGKEWCVPISINKGNTKYFTHFYIPCEDISVCNEPSKDVDLKKIINSQQKLIDKISIKNCKLEKAYEEYKYRTNHYEELLQNNRYELEKYKINEKDLLNKIKKYEKILKNESIIVN
tara:strand:+ start:4063 stop:4596 length:534 start_codon:yes stop_codon:yes gene_type:complete